MSKAEEAIETRLLQKALIATKESRQIEFKRRFDPASTGAWCEIVKDIVAIANSGGGIIVFGLDDHGVPTGDDVESVLRIDPADSTNRVFRYTGTNLEFTIQPAEKEGNRLAVFIIPQVETPLVFHKPGVYGDSPRSSSTAFHMGTVYFRHGAKSEPGITDDIQKAINRRLEQIRKSWIKGVAKVVKAPHGTEIIAVPTNYNRRAPAGLAKIVRTVNDPSALPVRLTRDPSRATGKFVHEEVSESLLNEINNVIDVNRILARGQRKFFLGQPVYFRVYAERHHAIFNESDTSLFVESAMTEFYAPMLYWLLKLPDSAVAQHFKAWYQHPRQPQCHGMIRLGALLGHEFSGWLWNRYHAAWESHPQPPGFHWTLKEIPVKLRTNDPRVVASRQPLSSTISVPGEPLVSTNDLLNDPAKASSLLSKACMKIFEGNSSSDLRATARALDYIAYGGEVMERSSSLSKEIIRSIADDVPAMPQDAHGHVSEE